MQKRQVFGILGLGSLLGLIALCLAWELWLAPLRPGGSWLVLKVAPLLFPLPGMLHRQRYTYQWVSMLTLLYMVEALVRVTTGHGMEVWLAGAELVLSLSLFGAAVGFVRSGDANA